MFTDFKNALALDHLATAYGRLDDSITVDGWLVDGLPDRPCPLGEAAGVLLSPATSIAVQDAVWRYLVARARKDRVWQVVCGGMALPSLRAVAARIIAYATLDPADVNSEITAGFLEALSTVDLDEPRVFRRLRAAAAAAGMRLVRADRLATAVRDHSVGSVPPPEPFQHPDAVLARAVAAYVITPGEADLIGATRLEGIALAAMAAASKVTVDAVKQRRLRAERRLVAWLTTPSIDSHADSRIVA